MIQILHDDTYVTSYCNNCLKDQCNARIPMCNTVGSKGLTLWDVTIFLVSSKMNWSSSKKTLTDLSSLTIMLRLCCSYQAVEWVFCLLVVTHFSAVCFSLPLSFNDDTAVFLFSTQSLKTFTLSACCSKLTAFVYLSSWNLQLTICTFIFFFHWTDLNHQLLHNFSIDC